MAAKADVALLVSILGLIWSGVTFYLTALRKGKLAVPRPRLFGLTTVGGQDGAPGNLAIALPLSFVNTGAKLLIVEDLKLCLGAGLPPFLWQTELDSIPPTKKAPLASQFGVPGYSSVTRLCGFVCDDPAFQLSAGRYEAQILIREMSQQWQRVCSFVVEVSQDALLSAEAGNMFIKLFT